MYSFGLLKLYTFALNVAFHFPYFDIFSKIFKVGFILVLLYFSKSLGKLKVAVGRLVGRSRNPVLILGS